LKLLRIQKRITNYHLKVKVIEGIGLNTNFYIKLYVFILKFRFSYNSLDFVGSTLVLFEKSSFV